MDLIEILNYIPPSMLDYQEWVNVGMALKHEGYSVEVWDNWSRNDSRYKEGDCAKKWKTFNEGGSSIVTGGTIHEMAKRFGYTPAEVRVFGWDDLISYDGNAPVVKDTAWIEPSAIEEPATLDGVDELRRYIQALFKSNEYVGFCTDASFDEERSKWTPSSKGAYGYTAGALLDRMKKHPKDITEVIGDYNREAGVWIRFNPLDGKGVKNENVTSYKYALVESDTLEIEKQKALMEQLKLPIAMMVASGGKSIHAIVKIDGVNYNDYREKVDYLYEICKKNGLVVDTQNKNPSRLSRMPGVLRNGKKQFIIAENIGCKDFVEWKDYIEEMADNLPDIESFDAIADNLPPLAEELIEGVLRVGHKMVIAGPSKAGKSFMLLELASAIALGKEWLGFKCRKGKVLYVNLEVDGASMVHRMAEVLKSLNVKKTDNNLEFWHLRGKCLSLEHLAPLLVRRARESHYAAIILDPLYKLNQGDENSAGDMSRFFGYIDMICASLKVSVICCHHHSKGAQGQKSSIDRASGSGVFARDPDALLDLMEIEPKDVKSDIKIPEGATAWRISSTLREFRSPNDIDVVFDFPLHIIRDDLGDAKAKYGAGASINSKRGNDAKAEKKAKNADRIFEFIDNWDDIDTGVTHLPHPTIKDAAKYFNGEKGFSEASIRRAIEEDDRFALQGGSIYLN